MGLTDTIKEHPYIIGIAVLAVAFIAYRQSQSSGMQFTGGGVASSQSDPGAVAIDEARIQAGTQNVGVLSSLILGRQQSADARDVASQQSSDSLSASLAGTNANLQASLAQTDAERDAALAQTEADKEAALAQTAASVDISGQQTSAQISAANITAQTQAIIQASNERIATLEAENENFRIQAQKDEARAADNTSIVNHTEDVIGHVLSFLSFGLF